MLKIPEEKKRWFIPVPACLTLHSLVPERFFKILKGLPLTAETAGRYVLKQSAVLTFQAF